MTCFSLALLICVRAQADRLFDGTFGIDYNDNLANAAKANEAVGDAAFNAAIHAGKYWQITDRSSCSATINLATRRQIDFSALDRSSVGASINLQHKFGLGSQAPWLNIAGSAAWDEFDFSPRDAWRYRGAATLGRRFGNRLDIQIELAYEQTTAGHVVDIPFLVRRLGIHGDAFDTVDHSLAVDANYALTTLLTLSCGYTRRSGDVVSSVPIASDIFKASSAITPDPTFGPGRFAYRIDADTDIFTAGLSFALSEHAALNVRYDRIQASGHEQLSYINNLVAFNLTYAF
ncbi:MAG: hypothetical protein HYX63_22800 [Gammaproteobacteria bacterium]|nr:hypothetical protein [Gammaproteobacteria bacterium]